MGLKRDEGRGLHREQVEPFARLVLQLEDLGGNSIDFFLVLA